jgi:hypothetical protein
MKKLSLFLILLIAVPAAAEPPRKVADEVSETRLHTLVEKLVSFGTRHTLSSQTDPKRGIGAALKWNEEEFRRYSRACRGCLTIATPSDVVTGRRVPTPTKVTNVLAIQRGTSDPNRVIVISGHIDSRVTDVMNATSDAPGANDDGSGTAAVIEAARVLSRYKFPATIVYAVLSGEEQGLLGGKILADYAKAQGWQVEANLNNDIIGNSCAGDACDDMHVRVFSEGPRADADDALRRQQRSLGGENDSPSRNLSRFVDKLADDLSLGLDVRQVWRADRFGRGGDHLELLNAGFPAIRFTVAIENYDAQHQDLRTQNGVRYGDTIDRMDFSYLTKVTKLNVAALASIASAPPPPAALAEGAVAADAVVKWDDVAAADHYIVRWRETDASDWQQSERVGRGSCIEIPATSTDVELRGRTICTLVLGGIRVDDWVFGVSSVSTDGEESPVSSAVPGGAFKPYAAPPAAR